MSLAIKWGSTPEEGGLIYFDAVQVYSQNYSGRVTKHPVDSGGNITDHFIKDNPTFTVQAVITGVDVSNIKFLIRDLDNNLPFNADTPVSAVSVNSTDNGLLSRYLPSSISQFLSDSTPDVVMDSRRAELVSQIRDMMINLMSGVRYNDQTGQFDSNVEVIQLYEFERTLLKRIISNLVITKISFNEDAKSGTALYCNITFEQVSFVQLRKVQIPKPVTPSQTKRATSKKSLGKCDGTVKDTDDPANTDSDNKKEDIDALRGAVVDG